ncbi:serine/arginine repetitive matrix protein 4 isoform X1 [Haplochromis burtoni]|uniref:serine/arginine repetitive matrix protein 4 isoform X1 n=1 Tax=Haplochromis burtoni TaxID=8153 RepID=UPI000329A532|nr:serine/arginine repetitive matrix protein 4 isoform X1 [Maylandia zebra]XP_005928950.1 serine/arginine repetitive matrix protein 4 isoform X1 [Haplochromis burtoni]
MQPPRSLQLGPCGASLSLGSQGSTTTFQLEEKQLFEKFWKGTFKAVATPRPESVIVASITASRRVTEPVTQKRGGVHQLYAVGSETTTCQQLKPDERKAVDTRDRYGCIKGNRRKHRSHRRARSPSFDEEPSPRPKRKKKKRKSERKRKRKRSPSYSLSPPRKKKKKKKKSSKKSKRHRYTSKKSKHSSSSLKHKRKDERKHKKSSRTHSRRRRRYRRSESETSSCQSSTEDRHHLQKSVVHQAFGDLAAVGQETNAVLNYTDMKWRPTTKSVCKMAPKYRSILSAGTTLSSKPASEILHGNGSQHLTSQTVGPHDYDSGNDTSSPPSSKTGVSQGSVTLDNKSNSCQRVASPGKLKFTERDNVSDSGNSVTSYASLCKPYGEDGLSATLFSGNGKREQITLGCRLEVVRSPKTSSCSERRSDLSQGRPKTRSSSSRSRSRSSGSSRYSGRYSRSPSLSSCSSYSRSMSNSADLRRRGSYSRYSPDRLRDRKRTASSRETDAKHTHKVSGKRRRRKSYSPMKKRRRDSPSHLEARRITSARKRPIPYFRPSPSSSSRCTSVSSWSSLFTRSRSRSPLYSISRSRSRSQSHSYSSYRSYSRSSSWNSVFGSRSRSRSRGSLNKRNKTRH